MISAIHDVLVGQTTEWVFIAKYCMHWGTGMITLKKGGWVVSITRDLPKVSMKTLPKYKACDTERKFSFGSHFT